MGEEWWQFDSDRFVELVKEPPGSNVAGDPEVPPHQDEHLKRGQYLVQIQTWGFNDYEPETLASAKEETENAKAESRKSSGRFTCEKSAIATNRSFRIELEYDQSF